MRYLKKIGRVLFVSFTGLLLTLLLLEIGLRIFGYYYEKTHEKIFERHEGTEYVILCIGDSFTAGMGAPDGRGYPAQLETVCLEKTGRSIQVANRGMVSANTSMIMEQLPENLKEVKPDMIICMMGGANDWNYWGEKNLDKVEFEEQSNSALADFFYSLRVYKLVKLISYKLSNKQDYSILQEEHLKEREKKIEQLTAKIEADRQKGKPGLEDINKLGGFLSKQGKQWEAAEWYRLGIQYYPGEGNLYINLNNEYSLLGEYEKGINWLRRGLERTGDPYFFHLIYLHYMKYGEYDKALHWLFTGLKNAPTYSPFYRDLIICSQLKTEPKWADSVQYYIEQYPDAAQEGLKILRQDPYLMNFGHMISPHSEKDIQKQKSFKRAWIRSDYMELIRICQANDIKLVLMTYPPFPSATYEELYRPVNELIREIARENKILLVDNDKRFESLGDKKKEYYHSPGVDDHPTEKGYGLMASYICNAIVDAGLIKAQPD
jgi:lysophospholipase L1-like esterase